MLESMGATEDAAVRRFAAVQRPEDEAGRAASFRRARAVIPGGVNSPVRSWKAVGGGDPFFVRRGEGAYLEDTDGNRYVDWVMSWGPLVFGHADEEVVEAVREAAAEGTTFGAPTEREIEVAEEITDAIPSVEMVRLVSSGTEAALSAVRLARGFTARDRIIRFEGAYHGHADALLADSPGVPTGASADTILCPYNDVEATAAAVERYGEGLACILVEPVAGNMGVVPPQPGFLEALRGLCDACGALLVFDEVITGFRVARGGAQELYGVRPDLTLLGKMVGGGLPLAAFGGRADVMERLAPSGPVFQAGTLSGNPLATAAALVVLRRLRDPDVYERLEETGAALESGLGGPGVRVQRVGSMLTVFFREGPVRNLADAQAGDAERYGAFFRHLLEQGVYVAPSPFEALFVSTAHGEQEVERTVEAARAFLRD
jgi:glutamate-1-semialdehyde 2,1-aminomutase